MRLTLEEINKFRSFICGWEFGAQDLFDTIDALTSELAQAREEADLRVAVALAAEAEWWIAYHLVSKECNYIPCVKCRRMEGYRAEVARLESLREVKTKMEETE